MSLAAEEWRDVRRPASERAAALLKQMTPAEKLGQLGSIWETDSAADFAPSVDGDAPLTEMQSFANGLGQLTRVFGTEPVTVAAGVAQLRDYQRKVTEAGRFGIPAIAHEECLTGVAAWGATVYPTPLAWGATFNEMLVHEMAEAIGSDLRSLGVHQGLAPVLDVTRDYRWGRVEETLGEDPYLVGQLGSAFVSGLEGAGVVATLKHFAGYSASRGGRNHAPVSMGRRELADIVLAPFETAIRQGGARSVMCAYTDLDGVPSALDHELLTGILRDAWGFTGTVVADYWAIPFAVSMHRVADNARVAGIRALTAGLDVELPTTVAYSSALLDAIVSGELDSEALDRSALRHLTMKAQLGLLDGRDAVPANAESTVLNSERNRRIAASLAEESLVLLQNRAAVPLDRAARIALIGPAAFEPACLLGCYSFPNHVLSHRPEHPWGIDVPSIEDACRQEFTDARIDVARGAEIMTESTELLADALTVARGADVVVLVVGDKSGLFGRGTSGEGCDAADLQLPGGQHQLAIEVLATGVPVVLVVVSGRPYALGDYMGAAAIVQAFLPGQEGARAIAGLLSGRLSPSGRLPVQIPRRRHNFSTYLEPPLGRAASGISSIDPTPLFPFGFGLTASNIEYEQLSAPPVLGAGESMQVEVRVVNRGHRDAVEVIQVYASGRVASVVQPTARLIAFARVKVAASRAVNVRFEIHADRLTVTGPDGFRRWEGGAVRIAAGPSSEDLNVGADVQLAPGSANATQSIGVTRSRWTVEDA